MLLRDLKWGEMTNKSLAPAIRQPPRPCPRQPLHPQTVAEIWEGRTGFLVPSMLQIPAESEPTLQQSGPVTKTVGQLTPSISADFRELAVNHLVFKSCRCCSIALCSYKAQGQSAATKFGHSAAVFMTPFCVVRAFADRSFE